MSEEPRPAVGQLWREVDPRFVRVVVVLAVSDYAVTIRNRDHQGGSGRLASISRFNGKRGGYRYVADRPSCSQCGQEFTDRACGPTHVAIRKAIEG